MEFNESSRVRTMHLRFARVRFWLTCTLVSLFGLWFGVLHFAWSDALPQQLGCT
jgi:hypothetical protein